MKKHIEEKPLSFTFNSSINFKINEKQLLIILCILLSILK